MAKKYVSYGEKLKDVRWQKLRLEVLERAGWRCECCHQGEGSGVSLHVHHGWYERGLDPWDYPADSLRALCEDCHAAFEEERQKFLNFIASWGPADVMYDVLTTINHAFDCEVQMKDLTAAIERVSEPAFEIVWQKIKKRQLERREA